MTVKVLITSGGTREPIDGVRVLTNSSTGHTGAVLADAFAAASAEVTLLHAESAVLPSAAAISRVSYVTSADLDAKCARLLGGSAYTLVIHAAAVSDFVVSAVVSHGERFSAPVRHKIDSAAPLSIELVPSKKILPRLKGYSVNPDITLVGFKLTDGASPDAAAASVQKVLDSGADFVVHNDVQQMSRHRATVWQREAEPVVLSTLSELADHLVGIGKLTANAGTT